MELDKMKASEGARKKAKRKVGRGDKTAGRGENGQKSRSGFSNKIGFEGGQNPLYKRIPKRGFTNINTVEYTVVNIDKLARIKEDTITPEVLIANKVIKNNYGFLKILGEGTVTRKLTVSAHKFSESAKKAIEDAGGKIVILSL